MQCRPLWHQRPGPRFVGRCRASFAGGGFTRRILPGELVLFFEILVPVESAHADAGQQEEDEDGFHKFWIGSLTVWSGLGRVFRTLHFPEEGEGFVVAAAGKEVLQAWGDLAF